MADVIKREINLDLDRKRIKEHLRVTLVNAKDVFTEYEGLATEDAVYTKALLSNFITILEVSLQLLENHDFLIFVIWFMMKYGMKVSEFTVPMVDVGGMGSSLEYVIDRESRGIMFKVPDGDEEVMQ